MIEPLATEVLDFDELLLDVDDAELVFDVDDALLLVELPLLALRLEVDCAELDEASPNVFASIGKVAGDRFPLVSTALMV